MLTNSTYFDHIEFIQQNFHSNPNSSKKNIKLIMYFMTRISNCLIGKYGQQVNFINRIKFIKIIHSLNRLSPISKVIWGDNNAELWTIKAKLIRMIIHHLEWTNIWLRTDLVNSTAK